jgi:hypothetical protein
MSRHNTIRASLAIAAAALAFGATSAGAMPLRDGSPPQHATGAGQASLDNEQSQALAAQQAQTLVKAQGIAPGADLRGADAKYAAIVAQRDHATAGLPGPPQFSTAKVAALHSTQPPVKDDDGDVPLLGIILGLAGAGILGAGAAFAVTRTTRSRRTRVAA